eukprot:tig00001071_g6795.t1
MSAIEVACQIGVLTTIWLGIFLFPDAELNEDQKSLIAAVGLIFNVSLVAILCLLYLFGEERVFDKMRTVMPWMRNIRARTVMVRRAPKDADADADGAAEGSEVPRGPSPRPGSLVHVTSLDGAEPELEPPLSEPVYRELAPGPGDDVDRESASAAGAGQRARSRGRDYGVDSDEERKERGLVLAKGPMASPSLTGTAGPSPLLAGLRGPPLEGGERAAEERAPSASARPPSVTAPDLFQLDARPRPDGELDREPGASDAAPEPGHESGSPSLVRDVSPEPPLVSVVDPGQLRRQRRSASAPMIMVEPMLPNQPISTRLDFEMLRVDGMLRVAGGNPVTSVHAEFDGDPSSLDPLMRVVSPSLSGRRIILPPLQTASAIAPVDDPFGGRFTSSPRPLGSDLDVLLRPSSRAAAGATQRSRPPSTSASPAPDHDASAPGVGRGGDVDGAAQREDGDPTVNCKIDVV